MGRQRRKRRLKITDALLHNSKRRKEHIQGLLEKNRSRHVYNIDLDILFRIRTFVFISLYAYYDKSFSGLRKEQQENVMSLCFTSEVDIKVLKIRDFYLSCFMNICKRKITRAVECINKAETIFWNYREQCWQKEKNREKELIKVIDEVFIF